MITIYMYLEESTPTYINKVKYFMLLYIVTFHLRRSMVTRFIPFYFEFIFRTINILVQQWTKYRDCVIVLEDIDTHVSCSLINLRLFEQKEMIALWGMNSSHHQCIMCVGCEPENICVVIKLNESEVGSDMLLVSETNFI